MPAPQKNAFTYGKSVFLCEDCGITAKKEPRRYHTGSLGSRFLYMKHCNLTNLFAFGELSLDAQGSMRYRT